MYVSKNNTHVSYAYVMFEAIQCMNAIQPCQEPR